MYGYLISELHVQILLIHSLVGFACLVFPLISIPVVKDMAEIESLSDSSFLEKRLSLTNQVTGDLLCRAADGGKCHVVAKLLDEDMADPNSRNRYGDTPLGLAAKKGHETIVERLLTAGADPNSTDVENRTSLWWATKNQQQAVVELLLEIENIDVNISDTLSRRTPLALAVRCKSHAIVSLILNAGNANRGAEDLYDVPPLWWAVQNGDQSTIKQLLDSSHSYSGSEINVENEIDYRCISHWLAVCDRNHDGCCQNNPIDDQQGRSNPRWIIDTENGCIVSGQYVSRYVTLSYVWNNSQDIGSPADHRILMLNTSNLDEFQKTQFLRGPLSDGLPEVIKDAMELVYKIGMRYL